MFLSDFSIKRPLATVVIVLMLMCLGLLALSKLRVNLNPDVNIPIIVVTMPYPGASPETVEREILNRVEKPLQSITGVDKMQSSATEGAATIVMFLKFKKNTMEAEDEIRNAIGTVRDKLPPEMREPILKHFDPATQPMMRLALSSSTQSHAEVSRLAEDQLAEKFKAIDGVAVVTVDGALKRELSVLLNAEKMRAYDVSANDVTNALREQNTTAPVGKVSNAMREQAIRLVGRIGSPHEFENIVIKRPSASESASPVKLGDVATIVDGFADIQSYSSRNGEPNVSINIVRADHASTIAVSNHVRTLIDDINKTLPKGTSLMVTYDEGEGAQHSLNNVMEALLFGALLTIVVVHVFLNSWRSTLITALSLPTSVITAFIAVWLCGYSLNFMTLLGLSLAIGVLIDDAIVVREHIVHHIELGKDRLSAAAQGTKEIGLAVAATTFSIVAVFIPVAFMEDLPGEWFRPFALTVTISVLVSLLISFTLDPMISAYWGDPPGYRSRPKKGLSLWLANFNHWFDHQADRYASVIAWALQHRRWMILIALSSFIGAIVLQFTLGGTAFMPAQDAGQVFINVRTPPSSSIDYNRLKVEKAAELARTLPETVATNSNVTATGGSVYVDIGKSTQRERSSSDIAAQLRTFMKQLIGAEYVVQGDMGGGGQKPIQIKFFGADSERLTLITNDYMDKLRQTPGAVDVGLSENAPKDEVQITLNRGLANALGISVSDVAQSLRVAFAGIEVGDWVDPNGQTRDVAVRLRPADRHHIDNIAHLPIPISGSETYVPLNQIATFKLGKGPSSIQHDDGKRTITVSANAQGRSVGEVTGDALAMAEAIDFPPGYGIVLGGEARDMQELFSDMVIALFMGIGAMYFILVIQFGSFTTPTAVMVSLPLSLIGVVIALLVTGSTLNLMSLIGIIMLMGLVAKNAILLLDCARNYEKQGQDRETALMQAGRDRFRPILMTTFALIAGMTPVAIGFGEGSEFYRPLAIAIIGGTITSTLLTLLVIPTFYDSIETTRDKVLARIRRFFA